MDNVLVALRGKKTYLVLAFGAVVIVVNHFFGPIPGLALDPADWVKELAALVPLGTLRAAIPDKHAPENGGTGL